MPDVLSTSSSALLAFQRTLATISHNVANAATEGYSRQRVELSTRTGQNLGFGFIGDGVKTDTVQRMINNFILSRSLDSNAELGRLGQHNALSGRMDQTFSSPNTGLSGPWSAFFDATQGVATQPASSAAREQLLSDGRSLATRIRGLDAQLKNIDSEINQRLDIGVGEVNRLSSEIARLNEEIVRQRGQAGGDPPNDLLDQRDRLAGQLANQTGAVVQLQDDGALNVFTPAGQTLVIGNTAATLTTVADPFRPERRELAVMNGGVPVRLAIGRISGELGGVVEFRQGTLDPAAARLGRIAATLAFEFNQTHRAGMDLYGQPGGDFFTATPPRIASNSANTGNAQIAGTINNAGALDGADLILSYNGVGYSAVNAVTGAAVTVSGTGSIADPLLVGGLGLVVTGAANAGDRFLVQPTNGAGGSFNLAITDPNRIAAASPIRANANLANIGNGSVGSLQVTDANNVALANTVDINFIDANTYTLNGGPPIAYATGDAISANGWTLTIAGNPAPGDQFQVRANVAGSSDNTNARSFAALDDLQVLDNGATSLNSALSQLTTSIGSAARSSEQALQAQNAIQSQIQAERDSTSGVNLDEEAANMLRFQQAYQAAAQMIGVADTMFQSLLSAVRR